MRRRGMAESAIEAGLRQENKLRCDPPLSSTEVRRIAKSVGEYPPSLKGEATNPWDEAESLENFLETGDDGADFLDPDRRLLARASVTEILSPRGLGKSLYSLWLMVQLARSGE